MCKMCLLNSMVGESPMIWIFFLKPKKRKPYAMKKFIFVYSISCKPPSAMLTYGMGDGFWERGNKKQSCMCILVVHMQDLTMATMQII
jgi:hypothetical protein